MRVFVLLSDRAPYSILSWRTNLNYCLYTVLSVCSLESFRVWCSFAFLPLISVIFFFFFTLFQFVSLFFTIFFPIHLLTYIQWKQTSQRTQSKLQNLFRICASSVYFSFNIPCINIYIYCNGRASWWSNRA